MNKPLRILIITSTLDSNAGGWGRYSADLVSSLKARGVNVEVCQIPNPLRFKNHFLFGCFKAFKLSSRYKNRDFDVVHCVVEPYAYLSVLLAKLMKAKCIITAHGTYGALFLAHPVYSFFQKHAYKSAARVVAVSNYTKQRIFEYIELDNITVIPNGINFRSPNAAKSKKDKFTVVGIGGIKERKGYHLVIAALGRIKNQLDDFVYYIIGSEQNPFYAERLRRLISEEKLGQNVVMTGSLSGEEKERILGKADLFVLTSVSDGLYFEGFGLVYLEANSKGIPVIGSRESGAEEAIKDGESGLLVSAQKPEELASAILRIAHDHSFAHHLSENAVSWAKAHDWSVIVKEYLKAYQAR